MLGHANSNAESKNRAVKGGFPLYNVTLFVFPLLLLTDYLHLFILYIVPPFLTLKL